MITEDYVSFETAKLLKEKGFNEDIDEWYDKDGEIFYCLHYNIKHQSNFNNIYERPTLQMAMKWIREKGFHIYSPMEIDFDEDETGNKGYYDAAYYPEIRRVSDGRIMYDDDALYAAPEQACETAIKYCLENLI